MEQGLKLTTHYRYLNQRGQAAVEYILLLVITVALVAAVGKAFKGVSGFMNQYIGGYTKCLMDYGELPSLGVTAGDQKKHEGNSECDSKFENFSLAAGRPPVGGKTASSSSSQPANGKGGAASKSKDGSDSETAEKSNSGKSGGSALAKQGRSKGADSPYTSGEISRRGDYGSADGPSRDSGKSKVIDGGDIDEESGRGFGGGRRSSRLAGAQKVKYRAILGNEAEKIDKSLRKKIRAPAKTLIPAVVGTGAQIGPYTKKFIPPPPPPPKERNDDGSGFSFGGFFRVLIIAAMIVAIVVFFGGQIMNYSNSSD